MSSTTPAQKPQGLSTASKLILFLGVPLLILILVTVTAFVATRVLGGSPVNQQFDLDAGSRVEVTVPNASMTFGPSDDDQIHVSVTGSYFGQPPRLSVVTEGDVTTVRGECREFWFNRCSLRVTVAMPESLPLTVEGRNGRLSAANLTGPVQLETTNGGIDARTMRGDLDLRTTNGVIMVENARSSDVTAATTNGSVDLYFRGAPDTVDARSTNGPITVRVPDDDAFYFVEADTTNGEVDTDTVPSDRQAERTITAETTNGNVTIERTGS
jgi:hypothetical protein